MIPKQIAMIGLGGIANTHFHYLSTSPRFRIVAGVEKAAQRREEFARQHQLPVYETVGELLQRSEIDGAIVATPPSAREEIISALLDRKIFVLSEKPLASHPDAADRLASHPHAEHYLKVGYCHRFTGAALQAREFIQRGILGTPIWMNICFSGWMPEMEQHWMTTPALSGGGALLDNGCHALDLLSFLIGTPTLVTGSTHHHWAERGDDTFALITRSTSGALGLLQGSYLSRISRNEWEITGTEATLRYNYQQQTDQLLLIDQNGEHSITVASPGLRFPAQHEAWYSAMNGESTHLATASEAAAINQWLHRLTLDNTLDDVIQVRS